MFERGMSRKTCAPNVRAMLLPHLILLSLRKGQHMVSRNISVLLHGSVRFHSACTNDKNTCIVFLKP